jgi:3-methylfumaryl-CoA hydratase
VADTVGSGPAAIDLAGLRGWIGRQETRSDVISPAPLRALAATLDCPAPGAGPGECLPEPWHWLFFLPAPATSTLDTDGHARRGDFLPPVPLPRRMWAGSDIRFLAGVQVGDEVQRISTIADVSLKQGSSGALVFFSVHHAISRGGELVLEEDQQLVYREPGGSGAAPAQPAPALAQWSREVLPDPVLLFRYSALTFNSHRIHYDRDYAVRQEGYPGLVVQGPLTATLLLDLLRRELPGARLAAFRFRGIRPLLEGAPLRLQGRRDGNSVRLWALDANGALAMDAQAELATADA